MRDVIKRELANILTVCAFSDNTFNLTIFIVRNKKTKIKQVLSYFFLLFLSFLKTFLNKMRVLKCVTEGAKERIFKNVVQYVPSFNCISLSKLL